MNAFITGMGWVTPTNMGCGRDHDRFEMMPGELPEITRKAVFDKPYPHFGRLDRYSRLGLSAVAFALKDAQLNTWTCKRPIGIIASTVHGCLETDIDYYDTVVPEDGRLASPNLFAYTLPHSYLGEAAIRFGLTGASYIIGVSTMADLWCLRLALVGISGGQFDKVLGGLCDLGQRPPYSDSDQSAGGALFFVIEKKTTRKYLIYGELRLSPDGELMFDGAEVKDLPALAQHCIVSFSNKKLHC